MYYAIGQIDLEQGVESLARTRGEPDRDGIRVTEAVGSVHTLEFGGGQEPQAADVVELRRHDPGFETLQGRAAPGRGLVDGAGDGAGEQVAGPGSDGHGKAPLLSGVACGTMRGQRAGRADRAPGRCRAGEAVAKAALPHRPPC